MIHLGALSGPPPSFLLVSFDFTLHPAIILTSSTSLATSTVGASNLDWAELGLGLCQSLRTSSVQTCKQSVRLFCQFSLELCNSRDISYEAKRNTYMSLRQTTHCSYIEMNRKQPFSERKFDITNCLGS